MLLAMSKCSKNDLADPFTLCPFWYFLSYKLTFSLPPPELPVCSVMQEQTGGNRPKVDIEVVMAVC